MYNNDTQTLHLFRYDWVHAQVTRGPDPHLFKNHKAEEFRNNTGPDTLNIINMGESLQD